MNDDLNWIEINESYDFIAFLAFIFVVLISNTTKESMQTNT